MLSAAASLILPFCSGCDITPGQGGIEDPLDRFRDMAEGPVRRPGIAELGPDVQVFR